MPQAGTCISALLTVLRDCRLRLLSRTGPLMSTPFQFLRSLVVIAFAATVLAACQAHTNNTLQFASIEPNTYMLDTGDRLRVIVFGQEDLSNIYAIDDAGSISMPLIGMVPARGKTTDQLEFQVASQLKNGFVRNPNVSIEIDTYRPFFILGEVSQPGQYSYVSGMTLREAIAIAGGVTERGNKRRAMLVRRVNGEPVRTSINSDTPLLPGDTIEVAERLF